MEQEKASEMPRAAGAGGREKIKVHKETKFPKVISPKYRDFADRITERVNQALGDQTNIATAES